MSTEIQLPIYMDHHATTPVDPRVLDAMLPFFTEKFGNAASRNHSFGWDAARAVERAREQVAELIGATAKEIVFTSGATESDNLAIKGIIERNVEMSPEPGAHIITQVTEHNAVLDTCKTLGRRGCRVTYLPVSSDGLVELDALQQAIEERTVLVTIMMANNEIGVLQPVAEIGGMCRERGILFHTDAVQAVGSVPVDVKAMNIDTLSLSAHKIYGPKGVGALFVRRDNPRVRIVAQMDGGGHEQGIRSGTLNVPGIVGLGKACEIARQGMEQNAQRLAGLRDRLKNRLERELDDVRVNGTMKHRLPGNLNMSFMHVEGETLMMSLTDIAVSSGSACTSAALGPSHVLKALGVSDDVAHSSIRFGLGRSNTAAEVDYVADRVIETVRGLRDLSLQDRVAGG